MSGRDRLYATLKHGEEARGSGSQAADGIPNLARGAIGGEGPRRMKHGGAEDDGTETESRLPHLRSQSYPELPGDQPPRCQGLRGRSHDPCEP